MFHYFTIKFHFSFSLLFASFRFKCFASLLFGNFCFEVKQSEAKVKPFFRFFFNFFRFFHFFFAFFRLIFVSLRFFRLIFAYFTFVFASDFWCFTSKWIMLNQAFFSLPSETKFSLQFQISLPKRKWGRTLVPRVQVKRRPSANGLLLRTHSAGPVSQTCLLTTSKARAATRLRNPRWLDSTTQN